MLFMGLMVIVSLTVLSESPPASVMRYSRVFPDVLTVLTAVPLALMAEM